MVVYTFTYFNCGLYLTTPAGLRYTDLMGEYKIYDEVYEVDEDLERAIIEKYFEKYWLGLWVVSSFIIGFLLGIIARSI